MHWGEHIWSDFFPKSLLFAFIFSFFPSRALCFTQGIKVSPQFWEVRQNQSHCPSDPIIICVFLCFHQAGSWKKNELAEFLMLYLLIFTLDLFHTFLNAAITSRNNFSFHVHNFHHKGKTHWWISQYYLFLTAHLWEITSFIFNTWDMVRMHS